MSRKVPKVTAGHIARITAKLIKEGKVSLSIAGSTTIGSSASDVTTMVGSLSAESGIVIPKGQHIIWDTVSSNSITTNSYGEMQFSQFNPYMGFLFFSDQDPRYGGGSLLVQNEQNSAYGPHLRLWKNRSKAWAAAGTQDGDQLGAVDFVGFDSADLGDDSNFSDTTFAAIEGVAIDVTDNVESGQIIMSVMNPGGDDDTLNDLLHIGGTDQGGSQDCAVVINDAGIDSDFRVESAVNSSAFFLQGSDGDIRMNFAASPHSAGSGIGVTATDPWTNGPARIDMLTRKINFEIITTIIIDIQLLYGGGHEHDVIGRNAAANAYIFSVGAGTPAGWIYKVEMICLEVPTSGVTSDINLVANTSGTIAEDADGTSGTSITLIDAGGNWTNGMRKESAASTVFTSGLHSYFLYLTAGAGSPSAGQYGAGKFAIKLYGIQSF